MKEKKGDEVEPSHDGRMSDLIAKSLKADLTELLRVVQSISDKEARISRLTDLIDSVPKLQVELNTPMSVDEQQAMTSWLAGCRNEGIGLEEEVFKQVEILASNDIVKIKALHARMVVPNTIVFGVVNTLGFNRRSEEQAVATSKERRQGLEDTVAKKALDRRLLVAGEASVRLTKVNICLTGAVIFITLVAPVFIAAFHNEIVHWLRHLFGL